MPGWGESGAGGSTAGARIPEFFIVGQPKSGTTALFQILRSHPQIYMSKVKEPLFFASDLRPLVGEGQADGSPRRPMFPATYEEYLSLFTQAGPDQRPGECSTNYLRSRVAAGAIAEAQPQAQIIALLREPASFLRSLHLQRQQEYVESEPDLGRALALEESRRRGVKAHPEDRPMMLLYTDFVHYVEQLQRFHAVFPRERVKVIIYDDFRRDNDATVRSVLRFLEVDDSVQIEATSANPTVAVRSRRLDRMVRRAQTGQGPISGPAHSLITTLAPPKLRRKLFYPLRERLIYVKPQAVDDRLMHDLRRRFKPEVEALSEYLDRDLVSLWGYDSLD
jgi:Sulfotransferase family